MAGNSKHTVLQLAAHLCENKSCYNLPRKGNTRQKGPVWNAETQLVFWFSLSETYSWQTELQTTRDRRKINDILEQRSTEIRTLYEECQDSREFILHLTLLIEFLCFNLNHCGVITDITCRVGIVHLYPSINRPLNSRPPLSTPLVEILKTSLVRLIAPIPSLFFHLLPVKLKIYFLYSKTRIWIEGI